MPRPMKIPPKQLYHVKALEAQLEKYALAGELKRAKLVLDKLKGILKSYHHEARLLEGYLKLYEAALESWQLDTAKRGFQFVRNNANQNTRLHLEATTLLAIAHLREQNTFSAEPLMAEVLQNETVIKSESQRDIFRKEVIERFDQEGALAALASCHPEHKAEAEVHAEAITLLRAGAGERELQESLGATVPQSVKDFLLRVDKLSKNMLPHDQRLFLPSPAEVVKNKGVGGVLFSGIKRKVYRYICDEESEVYQAWLHGGLDAILSKGFVASAVVSAMAELRIVFGAVAVGATAILLQSGINNFCEQNRPSSLMSLRKRSNK